MYDWLHYCCGKWEGWALVNRFNHTSGVIAVNPTDRTKSVRNRCLIKVLGGVFYVVTLLFGFFCGCRGFCHRLLTESDFFLFLLHIPKTLLTSNMRGPSHSCKSFRRAPFCCCAIDQNDNKCSLTICLIWYSCSLLYSEVRFCTGDFWDRNSCFCALIIMSLHCLTIHRK